MLTRREVIAQLKRIGVKDPSLLKNFPQDFEKYMQIDYGLKMEEEEKNRLKREKRSKLD